MNWWLSLVVTLPLIGACLLMLGSAFNFSSRSFSLGISLSASVGVLIVLVGVVVANLLGHLGTAGAYTESIEWMGSFHLTYFLKIDGTNFLPALLIGIAMPIIIASEWDRAPGQSGFYGLMLILQTGLQGALFSQDLFAQFLFWTLSSLPLFFHLGIWGDENREKAMNQHVFIWAISSALLLAAYAIIYRELGLGASSGVTGPAGAGTFLISDVAADNFERRTVSWLGYTLDLGTVCFTLISLSFFFRMPLFPFHGWIHAFNRSATASLVSIHSGVVVPTAIILYFEICSAIFPAHLEQARWMITGVGALNLAAGSVLVLSQTNLKNMISCLSVLSSGLLLMGLGSGDVTGVTGCVFGAFAVGLGLVGLGLAATNIQRRAKSVELWTTGGQRRMDCSLLNAPMLGMLIVSSLICVLGVPGTAGFVSNVLLTLGVYHTAPLFVLVLAFSSILVAMFSFQLIGKLLLGTRQKIGSPGSPQLGELADLSLIEKLSAIPLILSILVFGFYPKPLLDFTKNAIESQLAKK